MNRLKNLGSKIATALFFAFLFVIFFNGYTNEGPSKKKFKKLGDGVEDLTKEEEAPEVDPLKNILGNKRVKQWADWWKKCLPSFDLNSMENTGQISTFEGPISPLTIDEINKGPAKMFYQRSPDGKRYLNPYATRLTYRKQPDGWQPFIEVPCEVALYEPQTKKAKNILDCSALEGIDDAFWKDKDQIVLMGYASISRHMNVECEGVKSCIAPSIWVVDLKSGSTNQHIGPIVKRETCEQGGYLKVRLPKFFGE